MFLILIIITINIAVTTIGCTNLGMSYVISEVIIYVIIIQLVSNTICYSVDGMAVDWISNKLYYTDSALDIVAVLDPVHFLYRVLIQAEPSTNLRAIVLDPNTRYFLSATNGGGGKNSQCYVAQTNWVHNMNSLSYLE